MGMVDANNNANFYDGKIRVTSPSGKELAKYDARNTANTWPSASSRGRI